MDACHIHTHVQHAEVEGGYFRLQATRLQQAHSVGSGLLWSSAEDISSGKTRPCAGPVLWRASSPRTEACKAPALGELFIIILLLLSEAWKAGAFPPSTALWCL